MARPDRARYNDAVDPAMLDDPLLPYVVALLVVAAVLAVTGVVLMQVDARERARRNGTARARDARAGTPPGGPAEQEPTPPEPAGDEPEDDRS